MSEDDKLTLEVSLDHTGDGTLGFTDAVCNNFFIRGNVACLIDDH